MPIEVWKKKKLFGGYRKIADKLYIFPRKGGVYASWVANPISNSKLIQVSYELAHEVLGAVAAPCPHVGSSPVYGRYKSGYHCWQGTSGEDAVGHEECDVCGFYSWFDGNPRFRTAFVDGNYTDGHPHRTYLKCDKQGDVLRSAGLNGRQLTTSDPFDNRTLVVEVYGRYWRIELK